MTVLVVISAFTSPLLVQAAGRIMRVNHVKDYRPVKDGEGEQVDTTCAPDFVIPERLQLKKSKKEKKEKKGKEREPDYGAGREPVRRGTKRF